jgi:hypothetical protein
MWKAMNVGNMYKGADYADGGVVLIKMLRAGCPGHERKAEKKSCGEQVDLF